MHHHHWNFGGRRGGHGHGGHGRHGFFGRFGGGPRGGGNGFRAARMLASDDLQLIVLLLLKDKPRHGYEIIKELEDLTSGIYVPSPGVIYPALTYLEEMEYTSSETTGNKKCYTITGAGKEYLEKNSAIATETLEQLTRYGRKMAHFQREIADEENLSEDFGADSQTQTMKDARQFKMKFREIWHEMKDALRNKRDASTEEKERVYNILKNALDELRKG